MRRLAECFGLFGVAAALYGCPAKEAEDPRKILGDYTEHNGASGTDGARGTTEPRSPRGADPAAAPVALASKLECRAAARRIEEIALEMAVAESDDPDERAKLDKRRREELASTAFKARVEQAARDCVDRETTATQARCIAKAKRELDIERCGDR